MQTRPGTPFARLLENHSAQYRGNALCPRLDGFPVPVVSLDDVFVLHLYLHDHSNHEGQLILCQNARKKTRVNGCHIGHLLAKGRHKTEGLFSSLLRVPGERQAREKIGHRETT